MIDGNQGLTQSLTLLLQITIFIIEKRSVYSHRKEGTALLGPVDVYDGLGSTARLLPPGLVNNEGMSFIV
ncbi:uncharacterized protein L3040_008244 [Drepanopeziza brunnea f. sp. 'multigermtubi']|uniref:uncharacterized protein n=1 Tax=Drepanopeziza brunnea f. sp. 'multigermtubi' TaxID=698441 RepID=UPI002394CA29|nr:hypothetical protein L3040_008244 [Drepanopeziza brunnea f. sp. 'multigermtubi']